MHLLEPGDGTLIFLLTDFGTRDVFVGVMKAVIHRLAPEARVVDLCHGIPPGDITAGQLALEDALPHLPGGAIVCVVIDPGVGTSRAALAVRGEHERLFIAPDNGVLTSLFPGTDIRALPDPPAGSSATFHGRDLFAPWAARLWMERTQFRQLAPAASPILRKLPLPERLQDGTWALEVLTSDGFGNLTTNLNRGEPPDACRGMVVLGNRHVPVRSTFADVPPGEPVAYYNSTGRLELSINRGNASQTFGLGNGARIILRPAS